MNTAQPLNNHLVFVTGATGFLGHSLVPYLAAQGYTLRALVRNPETHRWLNNYNVQVVPGDITDAACIRQAIKGCRFVVHAAGHFRMWGNPEDFQRINVQGTVNIMRAALEAEAQRCVYVSTIAVAGDPIPGRIIDETLPPNPADPYQQSKLDAERKILELFGDEQLPAIILRPGAFYGPYGRYAFNRLFFEDPLKGLIFKVNGGQYITFPVYIRDVAAAIDLALRHGKPGEIYNISDESISHNAANKIVSEEAGIPYWRLNLPAKPMITLARIWTLFSNLTRIEPYYPINLRSYIFNNWPVSSQKAREELGFQPTPFRDGAKATLAWYRRAGFWWSWRIKSQ